jgi:NAD(P)-dependent dehydrogenase (short-subunit alcohol dehydrogenase family)
MTDPQPSTRSPPTAPDRTAIVTGGAKRIGGAIVRALAADGWHVVIHCHQSRADAEALAAEVGNARVVAADLADPTAAATIIGAATGAPPLGLLVNSASRFDYDRLEDFTAAGFDAHMAVNLRAPALLTRAFAAALPESDTPALVVNLLDAKLEALNPDYFTYTLSKIGLAGLTELAARTYAPRLRCAGIAPAVTLVSGPQSRENFEAVHGLNPLRRGVAVEEIVAALRFIIATPTFNAQTITLDGGQRLLGLARDVAYMVEK